MAAKTTKKRKITLENFISWLEGVEEMQPGGWSPNKEQWNLIRNKIAVIEPDVVETVIERVVEKPIQVKTQPVQQPASQLQPPQHSSIPVTKPSEIRMPYLMATSPEQKTKTPDIDTSDGKYESPFGELY